MASLLAGSHHVQVLVRGRRAQGPQPVAARPCEAGIHIARAGAVWLGARLGGNAGRESARHGLLLGPPHRAPEGTLRTFLTAELPALTAPQR